MVKAAAFVGKIGAMRFRSGVCAACGRESDRLSAWIHRDLVGLRDAPRLTVELTEVLLCPDCLGRAIAEAEQASRTPRLSISVAGALVLALGVFSVFGPPFWPALFRWIRGPSREETAAAMAQAYGAPATYKPLVLVPPGQGN